MKLIPITNATSWNPDPVDVKVKRNEFERKLMIQSMKPLQPLLRDLSPNPEDKTLYKLVLEANLRRAMDRDERDIDYSRFW